MTKLKNPFAGYGGNEGICRIRSSGIDSALFDYGQPTLFSEE